jgi:hypothetical protein
MPDRIKELRAELKQAKKELKDAPVVYTCRIDADPSEECVRGQRVKDIQEELTKLIVGRITS